MNNWTSRRFVLPILLAAAGAIILVSVARQRCAISRAEQDNARLKEQNQDLQQELARAGGVSHEVTTEAKTVAVAEPTSPAQPPSEPAPAAQPAAPVRHEPVMVPTPTGEAPEPRQTGLALAGTHVVPVDGGLAANLHFNPTTTEPLGIVAVVVRLPRDGDARILSLEPSGSIKFADVSKRVSPDGKFAIFQGTPDSIAALDIAISVSGPATADVRGTCGIGPYALDITATGASIRNP